MVRRDAPPHHRARRSSDRRFENAPSARALLRSRSPNSCSVCFWRLKPEVHVALPGETDAAVQLHGPVGPRTRPPSDAAAFRHAREAARRTDHRRPRRLQRGQRARPVDAEHHVHERVLDDGLEEADRVLELHAALRVLSAVVCSCHSAAPHASAASSVRIAGAPFDRRLAYTLARRDVRRRHLDVRERQVGLRSRVRSTMRSGVTVTPGARRPARRTRDTARALRRDHQQAVPCARPARTRPCRSA